MDLTLKTDKRFYATCCVQHDMNNVRARHYGTKKHAKYPFSSPHLRLRCSDGLRNLQFSES